MSYFNNLYTRTKKIAGMYTGTFIVIMILNQLLFFGFCLNPVCLIAAMPHVLFITAIIGSWVNKENNWGGSEEATNKVVSDIYLKSNVGDDFKLTTNKQYNNALKTEVKYNTNKKPSSSIGWFFIFCVIILLIIAVNAEKADKNTPQNTRSYVSHEKVVSARPVEIEPLYSRNDAILLAEEEDQSVSQSPIVSSVDAVCINASLSDKDNYLNCMSDAMLGIVDAQYSVGVMYSVGKGVEKDYVMAYTWLSLSIISGNEHASNSMDWVVDNMTPSQIQEARIHIKLWSDVANGME